MAKKEPKEKAPTRKMGKKYKIFLILFCLVAMAFLRTGFVFIIVAMLPSIVAYYVDQSDNRYTFRSIFYCNSAGVLPYLAQLIEYGPRSSNIQGVMDHPVTWLVVFGSAAGGFMLTVVTPVIAEMLVGSIHHTHVRGLQRAQKKIEKEWGNEITKFGLEPTKN